MEQAEKDIKRPSAKEYMIQPGIMYGFLLALLYLFLGDLLFHLNISIPILERLITYSFIAVFCGAVVGVWMGSFVGGIIDFFLRSRSFPMDARTFRRTGCIVQILTALSSVLVMAFLIAFYVFLALPRSMSIMGVFWLSAPIGVSMIASMYTIHRYMQELKVLGFVHERKSKEKHQPHYERAEEVSPTDNILIDETESQQQSHR